MSPPKKKLIYFHSSKTIGHYRNSLFCHKILNIYNGFPFNTFSHGVSFVKVFCVSIMDALVPATDT